MAKDFDDQLHSTGAFLFSGTESFLTDLSEENESSITGGRRSRSDRLRRRRRRRIARMRRRRRIVRNRSNTDT